MKDAKLEQQFAILDRELIENSIRAILELRLQAKFDSIERYLADDAVFQYVGNRGVFPYAGKYIGKAAVIDVQKRINMEIEMISCKLRELLIEGNQAFSRRKVHVRHRGTGAQEIHEIWELWYFADGLISESRKFIDISAYERLNH